MRGALTRPWHMPGTLERDDAFIDRPAPHSGIVAQFADLHEGAAK